MLWSTLRDQIRRELQEASATVWTDAALLYHANEAIRDIATQTRCMRDWGYTTAVIGQSSYDLPDRSLEVIKVFFGNSAVAGDRTQLARQDFSDWETTEESLNGTPLYYAIDDEAIYLRPAPDAAYEISYLRYTYPAELTADSDTVPFANRANAAIVYYVKAKANEQIKDFESADTFFDRYLNEVDRLSAQYQKEAHADRFLQPSTVW